ncbi:ferritin-like protein [Shewanella abyssi]|uniref:ferritin-like protein n=1 Tax=Shewanella abyssi TaxID=311789 RepID=UPI00200D64A4|nr:ferritin-like protein [Shewanella abyssi]MCL1048652.1 ferritin-like protein [Shewanella abyssi]
MSISQFLGTRTQQDLLNSRTLKHPKKITSQNPWTIEALREHLQWAVDVELYTIPFYMSAMYSVIDQASEARRLVRSVVNQEMLHMQCAANIANAYGCDLHITAPHYGGEVPHLDFEANPNQPTKIFSPYSTQIGPMDVLRINAMCIIECPGEFSSATLDPNTAEYSSIGEIYQAIREGAAMLSECIIPNNNQVAHFTSTYPDVSSLIISEDCCEGLVQVNGLIDLIVDQGEGAAWPNDNISPDATIEQRYEDYQQEQLPPEYQNHVDDIQPYWDHFQKFTYLRKQTLPETFPLGFGSPRGRKNQQILINHFGHFLQLMNIVFNPIYQQQLANSNDISVAAVQQMAGAEFGNTMYKVGAAIAACWENGVVPAFSTSASQQEQ